MSYKFKQVANEVIRRKEISKATTRAAWAALNALAPLHDRHVADITTPEVFEALEAVPSRHIARRAMQLASNTFRYAIARGQRKSPDPTADLAGLLKPLKRVKHRAAVLDAAGVRTVLNAVQTGGCEPVTRAALTFLSLVFVRPGEVRGMRWSEINLDEAVWTIPAERMKDRRVHHVPLSRQALAVLDIVALEDPEFVFPGRRHGGRARPLAANTLNSAMERAGVPRTLHVPHGWRATARTVLEELGEDRRVLELCLGHQRGSASEKAYARTELWDARVGVMQRWADWLDATVR
jgi:integrase